MIRDRCARSGRAVTRGGGSAARAWSSSPRLVPVFLLLLLGMLEFGFAFDQNLTLEYATREGARVGSALANGGGPLGCAPAQSPNAATVDPQILAAVRRVLLSPGSRVTPGDRDAGPDLEGRRERHPPPPATYEHLDSTPVPHRPVVDGQQIGFTQVSQNWNACSRSNGGPAASTRSASA